MQDKKDGGGHTEDENKVRSSRFYTLNSKI